MTANRIVFQPILKAFFSLRFGSFNLHKVLGTGDFQLVFQSEAASRVLSRIRARGPVWAAAHVILYMWDKFFDFVLYPLAIIEYGLLWGTGVMMAASLLICLALLQLYDRLADTRFRDLLGFESLKEATLAASRSGPAARLRLAESRGARWTAQTGLFLYLSLWFDPMTCTIFMRPADHYRMTPRYWTLFALSVFIGNALWGLLVYFGVESVQALLGIIV